LRFLIDNALSPIIARELALLGHDATHVRELGMQAASDEAIFDRAADEAAVMDRMLAGVSTRKFAQVGEPVGEVVEQEASSTSKSTVSELFIERTRTALEELMGRRMMCAWR
jgi:predicted nuclease of predicted toxin-antitoxin system